MELQVRRGKGDRTLKQDLAISRLHIALLRQITAHSYSSTNDSPLALWQLDQRARSSPNTASKFGISRRVGNAFGQSGALSSPAHQLESTHLISFLADGA